MPDNLKHFCVRVLGGETHVAGIVNAKSSFGVWTSVTIFRLSNSTQGGYRV